jgi:glycogen debranching enzyme
MNRLSHPNTLLDLSYQTLLELATDEGINASGKDEIYGCIFGRDSALTILKILRSYQKQKNNSKLDYTPLLEVSKRGLLTLVSLQGKISNPESGEEPGKFIHEFRKDKYEHLLAFDKPWYVYPDGYLRNYDSLDSTALTLIALFRYYEATNDSKFLIEVLPAVEAGLNWIITYGDIDKDQLLEYRYPHYRNHGGLLVQSWTDSQESIRRADGTFPNDPIAPVEVQGYSWLALKLWANFYDGHHPEFARKLESYATAMKKQFNQAFILESHGLKYAAQALDGDKNQIGTITGNPLLLLWATHKNESIIDSDFVDDLVRRSFMPDMFESDAGIRTMSTLSDTYIDSQDCYHNGSFWPILNSLAFEGLQNWGYTKQAEDLKIASIKPIEYFGSAIELYVKDADGSFKEYKNASGQISCYSQAWSAAGMLDLATE